MLIHGRIGHKEINNKLLHTFKTESRKPTHSSSKGVNRKALRDIIMLNYNMSI